MQSSEDMFVDSSLSRERDFLAHMERWASRWIWIGAVALVAGVLLLVSKALGSVGALIGGVSVLVGPGLLWAAFRWSKVIPQARAALQTTPIEARLKVEVRRGYAAIPYTTGELWPTGIADRPIAQFGTMTWCRPRFQAVHKTPARVYGAPVRGAAVVVSSPDNMLIGRVKRSQFGVDGPAPTMPRAMRFLLKRRDLS